MLLLFHVQDPRPAPHQLRLGGPPRLGSPPDPAAPGSPGGRRAGLYLLRRLHLGQRSEVDDALWSGDGSLSLPRSFGTSVISEFVIGAGASIGARPPPSSSGASRVGRRRMVPPDLGAAAAARRLRGGAGWRVYNVPLGGAIFTAEYWSDRLPFHGAAGPGLRRIATLTAYVYCRRTRVPGIPDYPSGGPSSCWRSWPVRDRPDRAAWIRLISWVSFHRVKGMAQVVAPLAALPPWAHWLQVPRALRQRTTLAHQAFTGRAITLSWPSAC